VVGLSPVRGIALATLQGYRCNSRRSTSRGPRARLARRVQLQGPIAGLQCLEADLATSVGHLTEIKRHRALVRRLLPRHA